jgi:hypothetical protein
MSEKADVTAQKMTSSLLLRQPLFYGKKRATLVHGSS